MAEDEVEEKRYSVVFEGDTKVYRYVAKDGPAKAEWENGDLYIGEYKNGKRNGKGLYKFAQGGLYKGDWADNLKHGVGEFEAPDKGKYIGEWRSNQRHGQGTYEYPNGDSYKGGWEAGLKHGAGSYFYKSTGSTASGRWVKGQLLHGSWLMSDGTKYVGTFANNLPSGEGLMVFANGVTQSGRFEDGRWVAEGAFATAHAVEAAPVDSAKQALRNLDKAVLKQDQIEAKLPKDVDGAPNLRQSAEFPVFGAGQPSAVGIEGVLEKIQKAGMDKVLWINLRKEPVIYVNDNPYTARDKRHLGDNLSFAGLSREQLTQLEDKLIERLHVDCKRANGHLSVYAGDHAHLDEVKQPEKIRSVGKVFEALKTEQDFQVDFHKQPFQGDGAPTVEDFDRTLDLIKDVDANHAIVFNDQTGGEQTTTGMVIASLIRKALDHEEKEEEVEPVEPEIVEEEVEVSDDEAWADLDDDDVEKKRAEKRKGKFDKLVAERQARVEKKKKEAEQDADDEERDLKQGQYLCVMKLVRQLQKKGPQLKADVDDVIEKNKHIVHIRDAILQAKEAHDQGDGATKATAKAAGARGLHTYFHLILFYVYLKESKKKETPFAVSFSKWLADHASWTALLTAGEFNWN